MAELVTVNRFAIPEFAGLPLEKSTLDDYLGSLPQEVIRLSFMFWSSDTGFKRRLGRGHSKKSGGECKVRRASCVHITICVMSNGIF